MHQPGRGPSRASQTYQEAAIFAGAAASAYYLSYGIEVMGAILLVAALSPSPPPGAVVVGVMLGIVLATILAGVIATPVWRHLATLGPWGASLRPMISFTLGFPPAYLPTPLLGGWYGGVAWYPGLEASLALTGFLAGPTPY